MGYKANFTPESLRQDLEAAVHTELELIGQEMRDSIMRTVREMEISDQGDLMKSITARLRELQTAWRLEVGPTVQHAWYVYKGTKPHWPRKEPIEQWARRKLNISPTETETRQVKFWDDRLGQPVEFEAQVNRLQSVTWAIMTKISREGTPAQDFLSDTIAKYVDDIPRRLETAMQSALA